MEWNPCSCLSARGDQISGSGTGEDLKAHGGMAGPQKMGESNQEKQAQG